MIRIDEPANAANFSSYKRQSTTDPKNNSTIYLGNYDLKYYLDRQEPQMVTQENLNKQLQRGRVLVFVVIRKKKPTDLPISNVTVNERENNVLPVPKGSKSI